MKLDEQLVTNIDIAISLKILRKLLMSAAFLIGPFSATIFAEDNPSVDDAPPPTHLTGEWGGDSKNTWRSWGGALRNVQG